jgi:hypothetical protein
MSTTATDARGSASLELSIPRLNVMRVGYLLMGLGLAVVKWPLLPQVRSLPLFEGVVLCILTAMSLLAFLGLRHPTTMLPLLVFEVMWKAIWLALVVLPDSLGAGLDAATSDVASSCSFIIVILVVTPWRHVWHHLVRAESDPWR